MLYLDYTNCDDEFDATITVTPCEMIARDRYSIAEIHASASTGCAVETRPADAIVVEAETVDVRTQCTPRRADGTFWAQAVRSFA